MQIRDKLRLPWRSLAGKVDGRKTAIAGLILVLVLFADSLLPLLGHAVYLLVEFTEQTFEDLLEWAFGLSSRQAQVVLVWAGLPVLGFFSWRWLRKIYAAIKGYWLAFAGWVNKDWSREEWLRMALVVGFLGGMLYLLG